MIARSGRRFERARWGGGSEGASGKGIAHSDPFMREVSLALLPSFRGFFVRAAINHLKPGE
jgi:hypothetical protein